MNIFDKTYEDEMRKISEGSLKSIATASMLGLGALGLSANDTPANAYKRNTVAKYRISDESILTKTLPFTKQGEGYSARMYYDTYKNPTIGYGANLNAAHIRSKLEKIGYNIADLLSGREHINETDAEILLMYGMSVALKDAKNFVNNWDDIDPTAKVILIDMSYNLGRSRLNGFEKFKAALESLDYNTARSEMIDSEWYKQTGRRSKRLSDMMQHVASRRN